MREITIVLIPYSDFQVAARNGVVVGSPTIGATRAESGESTPAE